MKVDYAKVDEIRTWAESKEGIVVVIIEALEGEFHVGDDLLFIVIAGDIRENVLSAMRETIDRLKTEAVTKGEQYISGK